MKKIFLLVFLFFVFSFNIFAKSGFEFNLTSSMGVGISYATDKIKPAGYRGAAFQLNFGLQGGYLIDFKKNSGLALLVDFDMVEFFNIYYDKKRSEFYQNYFLAIGLMPKFYIGQHFSVGLSAGVKVPYDSRIKLYPIYTKISFNYIYGGVGGSLNFIPENGIMSSAIGPYFGCDYGNDLKTLVFHVGVEFIQKFGGRIDKVS